MNRREQLAYMIGLMEYSNKDSDSFHEAIEFAKRHGVTARMHQGNSKQWFDQERDSRVSEWLMGQFLDMFENDNFIAMNAGINTSMSFLHKKY